MTSFLRGYEQMRTKKQTFTNSRCHSFAKFSSSGELRRIQGIQLLFSCLKLRTHECICTSKLWDLPNLQTPCTALQKTSQSSLIYSHSCNWTQRHMSLIKQSLGYCITYQVNVSFLLKQRSKTPGNPHFVVERVFMNRLKCYQLLIWEPMKRPISSVANFLLLQHM